MKQRTEKLQRGNNYTTSWFFKQINKNDKLLAIMTKEKGENS